LFSSAFCPQRQSLLILNMAYRDPYAEQYGSSRYQHQPQYGDSASQFNPYTTEQQPHQTYEQHGYENYDDGYKDEPLPDPYAPGYTPPQPSRQATFEPSDGPSNTMDAPVVAKALNERSAFDHTSFVPQPRGEKTARNLRNYRYQFQGQLWTKGGRGRCVGRFCCCTVMITLFLIISIFLALALWIRPPFINIEDVGPMSGSGSTIQLQEDSLNINLGVNISVTNPNYFSVNLKQIKAEIFYPINNTAIGGGTSNNVVFGSHAQTNFTFPFSIDYKFELDPKFLILVDLATKCGVLGAKSNINVNYKITLGIRILFVTISPVIANKFTFMCPLDANDIESLLKTAGVDLAGLVGGT